jgi:RHS repeat-associated protein
MEQIDGKWFYSNTTYDSYSRVQQVQDFWRPPSTAEANNQTLPSPYLWNSFAYDYTYDSNSFVRSITDGGGGVWWAADPTLGYDYQGRPVMVQKGSGHWTQRTYSVLDNRLIEIATGPTQGSTAIQYQTYGYDGLGNLTSRNSGTGLETFTYDADNRLVSSSTEGSIAYATNGNITSKSSVASGTGTFSYGSSQPHAVTGAFGYSMTYDGDGNLLTKNSGSSNTISAVWTGFDKPRWIAGTLNGTTIGDEFQYDENRSRVMHLEFFGLTNNAPSQYATKKIYALGPDMEVDYHYDSKATTPLWVEDDVRIYVPAPDGIVGAFQVYPPWQKGAPASAYVYHYDHLGTIQAVTAFGSTATTDAPDLVGAQSLYSYDPWGARRNPSNLSGPPTATSLGNPDSLTPRGYTGHEMLDDLGLVHMNGRIYDPLLGRFLSADILVTDPYSLQSYNRYTYVRNNPLTLTDPTGWWEVSGWGAVDGGFMAKVGWENGTLTLEFGAGVGEGGGVEYVPDRQPTLIQRDILTTGGDSQKPESNLSTSWGARANAELQFGKTAGGDLSADLKADVGSNGDLKVLGSAEASGSLGGRANISGNAKLGSQIRTNLQDAVDNTGVTPSSKTSVEAGRTKYAYGAGGLAAEVVHVEMRPSGLWNQIKSIFTRQPVTPETPSEKKTPPPTPPPPPPKKDDPPKQPSS